jgi:hypothetical protein
MKFTAEQALEFYGTDEAILINASTVEAIITEHGVRSDEYWEAAHAEYGGSIPKEIDAGHLFEWLNY